jgi:hypothetical protein
MLRIQVGEHGHIHWTKAFGVVEDHHDSREVNTSLSCIHGLGAVEGAGQVGAYGLEHADFSRE